MRKRYMSMKEIASTTRQREEMRATRKAAMEACAGHAVPVLLLLASVAYVAFGGAFALEASPVPEPETSMAAVAPETADAGGALRNEIVSARSENERR